MRLERFVAPIVVSVLLAAAIVAAQETPSPGIHTKQKVKIAERRLSDKSKLDPEVQALVDMAGSVPPEFAADVLLRLAESDKIDQQSAKLQLITSAFYLAESAQQPIKKRPGLPLSTDSRSGYLASSFQLNLDRLSLQSRAVEDALSLNQTKARILFEQIEIHLVPLGCGEALAYDLSTFYQTLGKVISNGFTQKEKLEGRQIQLLERHVIGLRSHSQVGPVAQLLRTLDLSSGDLGAALSSFVGSLATLHGDKRSFTSAARYLDLDSLPWLVTQLDAKGVPAAATLPNLRQYLVSNFRDSPCTEILEDPAQAKSLSEAALYFVNRFNERLGPNIKKYALVPVGADEIQGALDSSQPSTHDYWYSRKSNELLEGIRGLKFGTGQDKLLSAEDRNTPRWEGQLSDFLKEFESWEPNDEPADDFFFEKAVIYKGLIELVPSEPKRSRIIQSYVDFLGESDFQVQNRIEWFWQLQILLGQIRIRGLDSRAEVIQTFEKSRDPILSLYARLERSLPRPNNRLF